MCDTRKRSSSNAGQVNPGVSTDPAGVSCDNETWWGSNFGTGLDVAAPGVRIYATDLQGANGINTTAGVGGDYVPNFNGTSSATPNVAGVLALILSIRPTATGALARFLLESTTDKLGGFSFSTVAGQPNGTWNNQLGYGRVNAERAVRAAAGGTLIVGDFPVNSCTNATQSFTISDPIAGLNYSWLVSNGLQIIGPTTGNTISVRVVGNGYQFVQLSIVTSCGTGIVASKTVSVGVPSLNMTTSDDRTPQSSNYTYHTATAQLLPGTVASNYRWYNEVNGVPTTQITTGLSLYQWPIAPCSSKFYQLQVTTGCGIAVFRGYAYNYYGCGGFMVASYPNPASSQLTIEKLPTNVEQQTFTDEEAIAFINNHKQTQSVASSWIEYALYDKMGQKILYARSREERIELDLQRVSKGIYILTINDGTTTTTKRISVEK
jgi:hypothetical protein